MDKIKTYFRFKRNSDLDSLFEDETKLKMAFKINPSLHGSSNYLARNFTISCKSEEDLQASVSIVHSARCVHTNRRQTSQPNFTEPHTPQVKGILGLKKIGYDHHQHLNTLKLFFFKYLDPGSKGGFSLKVFLLWSNPQKCAKSLSST